jgi:hypothetical protein
MISWHSKKPTTLYNGHHWRTQHSSPRTVFLYNKHITMLHWFSPWTLTLALCHVPWQTKHITMSHKDCYHGRQLSHSGTTSTLPWYKHITMLCRYCHHGTSHITMVLQHVTMLPSMSPCQINLVPRSHQANQITMLHEYINMMHHACILL